MSSSNVNVQPPRGVARLLPPPTDPTQPLTDWLETHGLPLNTRCGGRGLCHGCLVELETPTERVSRRACGLRAANLPADLARLRVPAASLRDHSLHGVSVFELRHVFTPPPPRPGLGLALDIGTTTVAGALWDFSTGTCLADTAVANGQIRHGDNVVARIGFSLEQADGLARLRRALLDESLRPLIERLCREAKRAPDEIVSANAAGNPTMLHILAGESLAGLATYPFRPAFLGDRALLSAEHGLALPCSLELLPGLGPFVGSDITAGALASGLLAAKLPVMLIDFGTNGEILLKHAGGYLATATAAGPAFEGGRLSCGAPAGAGVISSLERADETWRWTLSRSTVSAPRGLSGAAYVDFIALAARDDLINSFGRFDRAHPSVTRVANAAPGGEYRIALTDGVFVTEGDVAELLQAKAAIAAGIATLLELAGITPGDLRTLYVAGGFGYHLDPTHAQAIGLLPNLPLKRVAVIGNSSLGGASLLLHAQHRPALDALLANTRIVELNQVPSFENHFTDALALPG